MFVCVGEGGTVVLGGTSAGISLSPLCPTVWVTKKFPFFVN